MMHLSTEPRGEDNLLEELMEATRIKFEQGDYYTAKVATPNHHLVLPHID